MALDIEERHLLRLGHGEEALETEKDFSRFVQFRTSQLFNLTRSLEALGSQLSRDHISPFFSSAFLVLFFRLLSLHWAKFVSLFFFFAENKLRLVGTSATMNTKLRHCNENCLC